MKKALVVGGNSGIGLALTVKLMQEYDHIYIVGKQEPNSADVPEEAKELFAKKTSFEKINLNDEEYGIFDKYNDINTLIITAGFGRVALFEDLNETEIKNLFKCNALGVIQIIKKYYSKIKSADNFNCAVMVSIAGHVSSPYFSVYSATKSALAKFIESVNAELEAEGYKNRILDVSPGSLKGTAFNGKKNDITVLSDVSDEIIKRMKNHETRYIPDYETVYKDVIRRYTENSQQFGIESYNYKKNCGRIANKPQVVVGYMSGTFDLFHIGHLNILKRAKEQCDYLIVSVHENGAWKGKETFIPYSERKEIVQNIKYVDLVAPDYNEDMDAWHDYKYDKLFVGDDYKGTERFIKYEEYFKDKNVEIVYFPYTKGTSSTQLRNKLKEKQK